jgi:hypothetical protein
LVFVISDLLYNKFAVIHLILNSHLTLLIRDISPTSASMYSLFKLGELHVAKCRLFAFREVGRPLIDRVQEKGAYENGKTP